MRLHITGPLFRPSASDFLATALIMFEKRKEVTVEISTPAGRVFSGAACSVELWTTDGAVPINPSEESYLKLTQTTHLTLRVGTGFLNFVLKNAAANLRTDGSRCSRKTSSSCL